MDAHTHKHTHAGSTCMHIHTNKQTHRFYICIQTPQINKHTQEKSETEGEKANKQTFQRVLFVFCDCSSGRQNSVRLADCSKLHAKSKLGLAISNLGSCHFYTQEVPILGPAFVSVAQFMCIIAFPKSLLGLLFLGKCGSGSYRHR